MKAKLRLLMVEDSDADAELMARNLAKAGLQVDIHRVDTERDFVQALQKIEPDVILSDFSLPQFDGLRALDIAVLHAPETPFIFVSGTIGEERAIDALRRGATDYVLKTNLPRLGAAVERALREVSLKAARAVRAAAPRSRGPTAAPDANLSDAQQHQFRDSTLAQPDGIAR